MVENAFNPKEFLPVTAPVHAIECPAAFAQLEPNEALYAYYMTRASWEGAKICWFQRSYESPALNVLLSLVFGDGVQEQKERALAAGVSDEEWRQFAAYSAGVYQNCGNFQSFGDNKFVPQCAPEKFKTIVRASKAYETRKDVLEDILARIERELYCEAEGMNLIGFPDNKGVTSYYSSNCTSADAKLIDEFCQSKKISPLNTRLFKSADGKSYNLRVCSQLSDAQKTPYI